MTRKKSPKPTRYIRTLRPVVFVFRVAISQPRMQHVEIQLEPLFVVTFEQSVAQIEVSLPALAALAVWTIEFSANQVADNSGSVNSVVERRLGDEQGRTTAHRKRSESRSRRVVGNVGLLGHLDDHVDTHAAVGSDTKSGVERRHRDEVTRTKPECLCVVLRILSQELAVVFLLRTRQSIRISEDQFLKIR